MVEQSNGPARPVAAERRPPRRVAIIDEDPWSVRALSDALPRDSFQPLGFTSAATALEALASYGVDVVLTAQVMTEMDGAALVRTLREREGASAPAFLIGVASVAAIPDEDRDSVDEWVERPYAAPLVIAALHRVLRDRPPMSPKRRRNGARWLSAKRAP